MKKLISLSMASLMLISCLAGCGDKDKDDEKKENKYVGNWEASEMVIDGESMTDMMGIPVSVMYQFVLEEDGKASLHSSLSVEEASEVEVKWTDLGDNKIEISVDGDALEFELKDDKLVAEEEEEGVISEIYLVKVDEFTEFDMEQWEQDMQAGLGDVTE